MKKQINPTIKAHLIRGAFYLLLLTAVCAIPFALAQSRSRGTTKRPVTKAASKLLTPLSALKPPQAAPRASGAAQATKLSGLHSKAASQSKAGSRLLPYDVRGVPYLARTSKVPQTTSGVGAAHIIPIPRPPKAPQVVLYDQYDNASLTASSSQDFEAALDPFDDDLADDFVVPGGQTWTVESIDADGIPFNCSGSCVPDSFNVFFYTDSGSLPGTQVYSATGQSFVVAGSTYSITLSTPAVLTAGTYWVEVQARMDFTGNGQFGWTDRTVQSNQGAAWQNPGGGFGVCPTWTRKPTCIPTAGGPDQVYRLIGTMGGGGTPSPTPTGTPTGCQFHVLIVYADSDGLPTQLQSEIQAEPNVIAVDLFDAIVGTPTLGELQQYEIVVPFSNSPFLDGDTLGNNLADYVDGGGIVVQYGFSFYGPGQPYGVNGRWVSDGYNAYDYSTNLEFNAFSLGTFNAGHPLMAGVTTLNSNFLNIVTPAAGATEVAQDNFGESLVAFRPVSGGHTTVGVTAYVGVDATQNGDWGKVIVNAGNWLANCQGGTPTPTATATPTGTPGGCTINGSIDSGDPTQIDRLFRSGIPQTCPASTTCAIFGDPTPRHYDSYMFTNTTGATQCVTVDTNTACTGTNFIFIAAYLGSFDPNNLCTNWIGDSGGSPNPDQPFSFNVDDGQTFVVVVSEVTPEAGCTGYTLTITPETICGGGGSPTPTPTASPTCTAGGTPGPWTAGSPYPLNDVRYGFAQTATHFYVFGGVADGTRVNNVNRMDLATGMWQSRAPMPFTSEAPTCALMESTGIVYCAEGDTGPGFAAYDIAADTWTSLAADPFVTDHYGSASGAFNGKVFVVGGTTAFSNAIWIYDVASNTWSVGTSAPTGPFLLPGYQQVGQFLYVVGGFDPSAINLTTTSRLDMSSAPGVWEAGPTFTPQRADFGLAYDAGTNKLYALGGDLGNDGNFFNSTNLVDELDVGSWPGGTWSSSPPVLPAPNRQANQAGFYGNGDIWSVGGINGLTFQFLNEVWHRTNGGGCPSPTPTATATATTPPATATPTATATATTPPATATPTATATTTMTPRPTPTPRIPPTPRPRPTPAPRPTP